MGESIKCLSDRGEADKNFVLGYLHCIANFCVTQQLTTLLNLANQIFFYDQCVVVM